MAKLDGDLAFTGTLGNISAYRMKGVEHIILRAKGGPSAKMVRKGANFINTRKHNAEFASATRAAAAVRWALQYLHTIPDYNLSPALTSLCWKLLQRDTLRAIGERQVLFTQHPHLLEGFSLSRRHPFETVISSSLYCGRHAGEYAVTLSVPALTPGANLHLPGNFAFYRVMLTLGLVQDATGANPAAAQYQASPWMRSNEPMAAQTYTLLLANNSLPDTGTVMIVGVGVEMSVDGHQPVKHAGAGKILAVIPV